VDSVCGVVWGLARATLYSAVSGGLSEEREREEEERGDRGRRREEVTSIFAG
jgi:hypothetical protein